MSEIAMELREREKSMARLFCLMSRRRQYVLGRKYNGEQKGSNLRLSWCFRVLLGYGSGDAGSSKSRWRRSLWNVVDVKGCSRSELRVVRIERSDGRLLIRSAELEIVVVEGKKEQCTLHVHEDKHERAASVKVSSVP